MVRYGLLHGQDSSLWMHDIHLVIIFCQEKKKRTKEKKKKTFSESPTLTSILSALRHQSDICFPKGRDDLEGVRHIYSSQHACPTSNANATCFWSDIIDLVKFSTICLSCYWLSECTQRKCGKKDWDLLEINVITPGKGLCWTTWGKKMCPSKLPCCREA